jgi:hypothetical protein
MIIKLIKCKYIENKLESNSINTYEIFNFYSLNFQFKFKIKLFKLLN